MWIYLPKELRTSASLPDAADSTCLSELRCQELSASVTVNGKLAQPAYWRRAWKTEALNLLRSSLTLSTSQANSSVAAWLESSADFPALTSALPESKPASSTVNTAASGLNIYDSFAKCNPDGSLSKMCRQSSLFQQEELYLEGLPKAGSMRSGYLFERPTLAPRTGGNGSSSTPGSVWTTPRTITGGGESAMRKQELGREESGGGDLQAQAEQLWQTPATDSFRSRGGDRKDEMGLDQQARLQWATPNSRDYKSESGGEAIQSHMEDHSPNLSKQVVYSRQDQATEQDGPKCSEKPRGSRRRLNPAFVCQLMGLPFWWTQPVPINFAPAVMPWFLSVQRRHLQFLCGEPESEPVPKIESESGKGV